MTSKFGGMFGVIGSKDAIIPDTSYGDRVGALNEDTAGKAETMEQRTVLGLGCSIEGKLVCLGPTRIDGDVEGEISADDVLIVGKDATIVADLNVPELHISGAVQGNIVALKRVTLAPTAHIQGDIRTPSLAIEDGAQVKGKIEVGPIRPGETEAPSASANGAHADRAFS